MARLRFRSTILTYCDTGTGKRFTGVNLVKTLLRSGFARVLVICQTNHALDTFLGSLLDKGVENMVRLGSRSKDERVGRQSL